MKSKMLVLAGIVICIWLIVLIVWFQRSKLPRFESIEEAAQVAEAADWHVSFDHNTGARSSCIVVARKRLTPDEVTTARSSYLLGNGDPSLIHIRSLNLPDEEIKPNPNSLVWGNVEISGEPDILKMFHDSLVR